MQVVQELHKFAKDDRSGRLMMVCLSPYVEKADATTIFDIARCILQLHVPDAVCIVNPWQRGECSVQEFSKVQIWQLL